MSLDLPPPDVVREALARRWPRHRALYAFESDLDAKGRYGAVWIVVVDVEKDGSAGSDPAAPDPARLRLAAVENGDVVREAAFDDFDEAVVDERFGGGFLAVRRADGHETRLARHSHARVPEAGLMCRVINDLKAARPVLLPEADGPARCPRCGRPLSERGGVCTHCVRHLAVFGRLAKLLRPYRARVVLMMAVTVLGIAAQTAPPYITQRITDEIIVGEAVDAGPASAPSPSRAPDAVPAATTEPDTQADTGKGMTVESAVGAHAPPPPARARRMDRLPVWVGLMVLCALAYLGFRYVGTYLASWLSSRIIADLRTRLHAHLQRLRLSYFAKREDGELVSRVMHDTQELQHFLIDGLPYLVVNGLAFVAIAAILLAMDWRLALVVFVPVPFLLGGVRWIRIRLEALFAKDGALHGALYSVLGESVRGIKAVKAAAREEARGERFARVNREVFEVAVRIDKNYIFFSEGTQLVMSLAVAAVWYLAVHRIGAGGGPGADGAPPLSLGTLVAYLVYINLFYGPLQWFTVIANWMNHALASAERVFSVLDTQPERYDAPDAVDPGRLQGRVAFRDVRFSYERGKEVIKGISFELEPGEMVGLVGKSGAGKSTIVNLLCRFYDVDGGDIEIDGEPIRRLRLDVLRRQIGFVMQEPFLFRASLADNIRYGAPEASFDAVVRAARAANAHEFILDKEHGYDTIVGDGGDSLSGGEKQRIAIARALLSDPPILILDEATSSVDTETEKRIQDALATLVKGRSVIAIAHRLATLRNADRLLVVHEGRLAESGTHEQLLGQGGIYAGLVKTQTELNRIQAESAAL